MLPAFGALLVDSGGLGLGCEAPQSVTASAGLSVIASLITSDDDVISCAAHEVVDSLSSSSAPDKCLKLLLALRDRLLLHHSLCVTETDLVQMSRETAHQTALDTSGFQPDQTGKPSSL